MKRAKSEKSTRRLGLREAHERRPPTHFEDYKVYSAIKAFHAIRRGSDGIRACDVKIPRNYRGAMRSRYSSYWTEAMDKEIQALKDKQVLDLIPRSAIPPDQHTIKTMWVFDLKSDHLGHIIRFRARIVARGDKQRRGIDYQESFSPVARMVTFRLFVAMCVWLGLKMYQGDVNTACLNAELSIKQYLNGLEGYPCEQEGWLTRHCMA